jgi:hypothetical protein
MNSLAKVYIEYRSTLSEKSSASRLQNSIFRQLIPALGGPAPEIEHTRQPIPEHSIDKGIKFLETLQPETLVKAPDLLTDWLRKKNMCSSQLIKLRLSLQLFLDWARSKNYVPQFENPIPQADLVLRDFSQFSLKPSTPLSIWCGYLKETNLDRVSRSTLQNALIRYLVPAIGGKPLEHKKRKATQEEIEQGIKIIEAMPLELFDKALEIADRSMKSLGLSFAQRMRSRRVITKMLEWAKDNNYLPSLIDKGRNLTPWKSANAQGNQTIYNPRKIFEAYSEHLEECDRIDASRRIKSLILRTFIPALKGPEVQGKRADSNDLERGVSFLEKVPLTQLQDIYYEKISIKGSAAEQATNRRIFREMFDWACSEGYLEYPEPKYKEEVQFNFFHASPKQAKQPPPQIEQEKKNQRDDFTLGTWDIESGRIKPLADVNYINPELDKELIEYYNWRLSNGSSKGGFKSEINQVIQSLGWLHRHKKISLESMSLNKFIWKFELILSVSDDIDDTALDELFKTEKKLLRIAQQQSDKNKVLIEEYLKFRGGSSGSQLRYISVSIAVAKFVYRDTLYTDLFPIKESIPILRKLLVLQSQAKKEKANTPNSRSFYEQSVSWEQAILLVEHRRIAANKTITHNRTTRIKRGYCRNVRPECSLANDLQRFLSVAFSVIVFPSRSRSYYELEIGRTFQEGAFINSIFYPDSELKTNPLWDGKIKYYLFHNIEDSKIGKSQHEHIKKHGWWAEIPDFPFSDGSTLYTYIRRWLRWGRNVDGKPNHNFFFFAMIANKKPLNASDWRSRIVYMFKKRYGVRVAPQVLRQMFVTYLNEQNAPPEVMKGEACALEHSEGISQKNYNMMGTVNTMKPLMDFHQAFIKTILNPTSKS